MYLQPRVRVMIGDVPTLTGSHVRAVLMFAEDTHAVANWWAAAFGVEQVEVVQDTEGDFVSFETHGVELGIHPADEQKNPVGGSPVVYCSVPSAAAGARGAAQTGRHASSWPTRRRPRQV